jgi:ribosomal protein L37AE/L43A
VRMQCPNCMGKTWEWERLPSSDILICAKCGCKFHTISGSIYVEPIATIGAPDTAENLGIGEDG